MPQPAEGVSTAIRRRLLAAAWLAGLVFGLTACGGLSEPSRRLETAGVILEYHDKQTDREISSLDLDHPKPIGEDQVAIQLHSLYYESLNLVAKPRVVFHREQVQSLKRLLTKALNHAKPNAFISFEVAGEGGTTAGDLFASGGKLHWRLAKIEGENYNARNWARLEKKWRLVPRQGQSLFIKKILMEQEMQNWIVADMDLPAPAVGKPGQPASGKSRARQAPQAPPAPPAASPVPSSKDQELERKLQTLQNLKDKQLIDEEEYNRRRKQLLDSYF